MAAVTPAVHGIAEVVVAIYLGSAQVATLTLALCTLHLIATVVLLKRSLALWADTNGGL